MKQLALPYYRGAHDWLVKPIGYDTCGGVKLGMLIDADTESDAWRIGTERWGALESVVLDDIE